MTRREHEWADRLSGQVGGRTPGEVIGELLRRGLIDLRALERAAIRSAVEELQHAGRLRCEAMKLVAERHCCSYEKVRAACYMKSKNA